MQYHLWSILHFFSPSFREKTLFFSPVFTLLLSVRSLRSSSSSLSSFITDFIKLQQPSSSISSFPFFSSSSIHHCCCCYSSWSTSVILSQQAVFLAFNITWSLHWQLHRPMEERATSSPSSLRHFLSVGSEELACQSSILISFRKA